MSLYGLCQPTLIQINSTLCSAVIACCFFFARLTIPPHGFSNDAWPLSVCCVSHANPTPSAKLCYLCVNMSHASFCMHACFLFLLFFFFFFIFFGNASLLRRSNLRLKITNGGDTANVNRDCFTVRKPTLDCSVSTNSRFCFCRLEHTPTSTHSASSVD